MYNYNGEINGDSMGPKVLKKARGFTIMEILVVLAVISILGAISIKPLSGFLQRIKLQNAANGIKYTLLNARVRAMSNSYRHCGVVISLHASTTINDSVFAFLDKPPYNSTNPLGWNLYNKGVDSLYGQPFVVEKKNKITTVIPSGSPSVIVFRGDGSANATGLLVLTLGNFQDTVKVLASTGKAKVVVK